VSTPPNIGPTALPIPAAPRISPPARPAFRQRREGHAEDRRPHHRPADPHQRATGDQPRRALGRPSEHREAREDRRAEDEDALSPEDVGQPAADDDQYAERQRVGVDHPLHRADVGVELLLDRRQRHGERGEVVGDDEHRDSHRHQRKNRLALEWLLGAARRRCRSRRH
jgi:hypothetical protein